MTGLSLRDLEALATALLQQMNETLLMHINDLAMQQCKFIFFLQYASLALHLLAIRACKAQDAVTGLSLRDLEALATALLQQMNETLLMHINDLAMQQCNFICFLQHASLALHLLAIRACQAQDAVTGLSLRDLEALATALLQHMNDFLLLHINDLVIQQCNFICFLQHASLALRLLAVRACQAQDAVPSLSLRRLEALATPLCDSLKMLQLQQCEPVSLVCRIRLAVDRFLTLHDRPPVLQGTAWPKRAGPCFIPKDALSAVTLKLQHALRQGTEMAAECPPSLTAMGVDPVVDNACGLQHAPCQDLALTNEIALQQTRCFELFNAVPGTLGLLSGANLVQPFTLQSLAA